MGDIQALTYPTVDPDGFCDGTLAISAVVSQNSHRVVQTPVPDAALADLQRWRWVVDAWVATVDYRSHAWYDPDNTDSVYRASAFDVAPPVGWTLWLPGSSRVIGNPQALALAKSTQWSAIKAAREAALAAPLVTPYGVFDATPDASANIIKSVLLANNLVALGYPVAIHFTLYDNTVVVLDAVSMVQVGLVLAGREQAVRDKATDLRAKIEAATSVVDVAAVVW